MGLPVCSARAGRETNVVIVSVAMNPRGVRSVERSVCIMLDVLRASSTMLAMFQAGARELRALATFHPAFLLRSPLQKRLAWRDFLALRKALAP